MLFLDPSLGSPYLFVGSGLSRRYLQTDSWAELLTRFAAHTNRPFKYYISTANGDLPTAARLIAEAFHEIWWTSDAWATQREKFTGDAINQTSALRIEIAEHLTAALNKDITDAHLQNELDILSRSNVDAIITTNWDTHLEQLFPSFRKYIGQDQLVFSPTTGIGEIYKIHGCSTDPNSLVLTDVDYNIFTSRNSYLAAKLLTAFVEHQVVFLGYSFSDPHIIDIIYSVALCLTEANIDKLRNRLIFVEWDAAATTPVTETSFLTPAGKIPLPIVRIRTGSFAPIYKELAAQRRKFPAHTLRLLKEHVYEIVQSSVPQDRLYVADIDEAEPSARFDVVFGVGVREVYSERGYTALNARDLFQDALSDEEKYDGSAIISQVAPRLLRGNRRYLPVFKYLSQAKMPATESHPRWIDLPKGVRDYISSRNELFTASVGGNKSDRFQAYAGFAEFSAGRDVSETLTYGHLLGRNKIDPNELRTYLRTVVVDFDSFNTVVATGFDRLVCIYDLLQHGPPE